MKIRRRRRGTPVDISAAVCPVVANPLNFGRVEG
jgi:hypothetical protein